MTIQITTVLFLTILILVKNLKGYTLKKINVCEGLIENIEIVKKIIKK